MDDRDVGHRVDLVCRYKRVGQIHHPSGDFKQEFNYAIDTKTGLYWSSDYGAIGSVIPYYAKSCAMVTSGGFVDWRAPTLAELQTLAQLTSADWSEGTVHRWQDDPSPPMASNRGFADKWCADNDSGLPGPWRVPTLGELRQLAMRDTKSHSESAFRFDEGTYFIASTPAPKGWEAFAWHILFPQGGTDHGPDWANGAPTTLPSVRVACVK